MQVVNFVQLPNKKPGDYILALTEIYRFIRDHQPGYVEFRRFLMERDLFDKDTYEVMFEFLAINAGKGKPTTCGQFLQKLFDADTPQERNKIVFNHLARKNEILVKYVMDGLNERLYSTNELYRFITSYVYPGTYITLVHFKAWMTWLEACQHIKMVGIRWGLSETGEEAMNYVKTIDVDMVLDGESESADEDADDEDSDDSPPAAPPSKPAASAPSPVPQHGYAKEPYDDGPNAAHPPAAPTTYHPAAHPQHPAHTPARASTARAPDDGRGDGCAPSRDPQRRRDRAGDGAARGGQGRRRAPQAGRGVV
jgi:hypothetical protein